MKLTNAQALNALKGVSMCLAYTHPKSQSGVKQPVSLQLVKLRRELTQAVTDYSAERDRLLKLYGHPTGRSNGDGEMYEIPAANVQAFREELSAMDSAEVEYSHTVSITDLVCRDENGSYVPIEPAGDCFDLLGPLLLLEGE